MIELDHPNRPLSRLNWADGFRFVGRLVDQVILKALVIPLF